MVSNRVSPLILGLANIEPSTVAGTFVARYEIWDINTMANRTDRTTAAMAVPCRAANCWPVSSLAVLVT